MAKKKTRKGKKAKARTFPCELRIGCWGEDNELHIVHNPKDCARRDETETLAVYKLDSFLTITNKTTVTPVKPAKKAATKARK